MSGRTADAERKTLETEVRVSLDLDGVGSARVDTPLPFLSHMLEQVARHAAIDLEVVARGDVDVDGHHTTEDVGIVLGTALLSAIGDGRSIRRYGSATLPMDDALVSVALDLSGRACLVWRVPVPKAKIGTWDAELAEVFFEGVARAAKMNLHVRLHEGHNLHHIVEVCFKAFARALRQAVELDPRAAGVPSTKGVLV